VTAPSGSIDSPREDVDGGEVMERCGVCGSPTTNTALPVFDEALRVCDKCQRGLWQALKGRGFDGE